MSIDSMVYKKIRQVHSQIISSDIGNKLRRRHFIYKIKRYQNL